MDSQKTRAPFAGEAMYGGHNCGRKVKCSEGNHVCMQQASQGNDEQRLFRKSPTLIYSYSMLEWSENYIQSFERQHHHHSHSMVIFSTSHAVQGGIWCPSTEVSAPLKARVLQSIKALSQTRSRVCLGVNGGRVVGFIGDFETKGWKCWKDWKLP